MPSRSLVNAETALFLKPVGEVNDQDAVFADQAYQGQQTDLRVDVHRGEADDAQEHAAQGRQHLRLVEHAQAVLVILASGGVGDERRRAEIQKKRSEIAVLEAKADKPWAPTRIALPDAGFRDETDFVLEPPRGRGCAFALFRFPAQLFLLGLARGVHRVVVVAVVGVVADQPSQQFELLLEREVQASGYRRHHFELPLQQGKRCAHRCLS